MEFLIIILLSLRVFFNLLVLPDRLEKTLRFKEILAVEKIAEITQNMELKLLEFELRIENRKLRLSLITRENDPPGS